MPKQQLYAIGILKQHNQVKFVTSTQEHNIALWEDGKEAKLFCKSVALDMCQGFAWNGIPAIPILKQDYITLQNEREEN